MPIITKRYRNLHQIVKKLILFNLFVLLFVGCGSGPKSSGSGQKGLDPTDRIRRYLNNTKKTNGFLNFLSE